MRLWQALLLLSGCDKLFGLAPVPDAAIDAAVVDASLYQIGCADGTREGFTDISRAPEIAGCAGAWTIGGIKPPVAPACDRRAGNTGENLIGTGCTVSDLCTAGWYVCSDRLDVLARIPEQTCAGISTDNSFFATGQSGPGGGMCDATGTNDVFGCGMLGAPVTDPSCAPLDRMSGNDCFDLRSTGGWECFGPEEPKNLKKTDPLVGGGVLCCQSDPPGL